MANLKILGEKARAAAMELADAGTAKKNAALKKIAEALRGNTTEILEANKADCAAAEKNGMSSAMLDRLRLTPERIDGIAEAALHVADLEDPVGLIDSGWTRENGLKIVKVRVPLGVVAIIYESRPNVTVDAAALTLKSGNACILRGGSEAVRSNTVLIDIMRAAVASAGLPADAVQTVPDTSRETASELMRLNGYIDVLIPRGGHGLIRSVVKNATVPVIATGEGNCHVYVDESADLDMAVNIILNAKASRPSVCNAAETLLVHAGIAEKFLPAARKKLAAAGVELRGDERTMKILGEGITPAAEEDYATEFDDYILAVRVVDSLREAIDHINRYGTRHSEAIVTNDYKHADEFMRKVDAAAVYLNASTRFTDGGEFGFGAEIGISTQKLHARGPMGLKELTSYKYLVYGDGQVR